MVPPMRRNGEKTKYPGVKRLGDREYRIRGKARNRRTGEMAEIDRVLVGVSIQEAVRQRGELLREATQGAVPDRPRLGEYAKLWSEAKGGAVEPGTADRYTTALELHILKRFGSWYCDAIRPADVQAWVNEKIAEGYSVETVKGWFRVLRVMIRDAIAQLELPRDPTLRIIFPETVEKEGNELDPEELVKFLAAVERLYPQHHALAAVLGYTGLRFTHVTGLQWADVDDENRVIYVRRKAYRGHVGQVTKKKRAPKEVPIPDELAFILRMHRQTLIAEQHPGLASGWVFPTRTGKPVTQGNYWRVWNVCAKAAGLGRHFQIHGMRRTFNDHLRLAEVDPLVRKDMVGHVTEKMQVKYSTVRLEEKRRAVAGVVQLVTKEKG